MDELIDFEERVLTTFEAADNQLTNIRKALEVVAKRVDQLEDRLKALEYGNPERN